MTELDLSLNADRLPRYQEMGATRRLISPGAEHWLGVPIKCLDHGFIYLTDYMGTDDAIDEAARTSYGVGTRSVNAVEGLLRFLMRHRHTSPYEMVEIKFHAKHPIFVARQWVRHRTASLNEYSGRYSVIPREFYVPEPDAVQLQDTKNRQGRGEHADDDLKAEFIQWYAATAEEVYDRYVQFAGTGDVDDAGDIDMGEGIARELARGPLGTQFYTQWYWKIDLHNLFHFLGLRMDPHAQLEIRVYADAMAQIVEAAFPIAYKAFEDYKLYALNFSRLELDALEAILSEASSQVDQDFLESSIRTVVDSYIKNGREKTEALSKFERLGLSLD